MSPRLRDARPTRRGWAVALVAAAAFLAGATGGSRALNAVVVPALVALSAGAAQLSLASPPTVDRSTPRPGFPGESRPVTVTVDAEVPCRVTDSVAAGLATDAPATAAVGHGGRFEYAVELLDRGEQVLGPATCRLTDSLGLFAVTVETGGTSTALVYPSVYHLEGDGLSPLVRRVRGDERVSFDRLREFGRGDTRRDIHWRASAKRQPDEFLVAEYDSPTDVECVTVVGEAAAGGADAMADAVASIVAFLHDAGIPVTVVVPAGRVVAHPGDPARPLGLLAVTGHGFPDAPAGESADVRVVAREEVTVSLSEQDVEFGVVGGDRRGPEVAP
jgi:uncharacterized protein (DUF58 family)